jgi:hypothetical protein
MSQQTHVVNDELIVNLQIKVSLKSFSNHDGFFDEQIETAITEFKEKIKLELESKLISEYQQQDFLNTVDFVNYEVEFTNK